LEYLKEKKEDRLKALNNSRDIKRGDWVPLDSERRKRHQLWTENWLPENNLGKRGNEKRQPVQKTMT